MRTRIFIPVAVIAISASLACQSSNEPSGIASLRAIISAEMTYAAVCATGGYATSLEDLARPDRGNGQGFISPDLATNGITVGGYKFTLAKDARKGVVDVGTAAGTCNGSARTPASSFFASAEPVRPSSGDRFFAADERGLIFYSTKPILNPIVESAAVVRYK